MYDGRHVSSFLFQVIYLLEVFKYTKGRVRKSENHGVMGIHLGPVPNHHPTDTLKFLMGRSHTVVATRLVSGVTRDSNGSKARGAVASSSFLRGTTGVERSQRQPP